MMQTKLTKLLGIDYPIIQSGMQWLAVPQLASAVSNAGGIGTINLTCWPTLDEFADALDEMNSLTSKPYIVNISLAPSQRTTDEIIRAAIKLCGEKHVAAIETSAESPVPYMADIRAAKLIHIHKCPNYKVSMSMERKGLDAVYIAGYEAGGHPSADGVCTFVIARRCAADMKIPVVACGGVADGHGLAAALCLGASGVAMGTRFVNTTECPISHNHQQWVIDHTEKDTVLAQRPRPAHGLLRRADPQGAVPRHQRQHDPSRLHLRRRRQRHLLHLHGHGPHPRRQARQGRHRRYGQGSRGDPRRSQGLLRRLISLKTTGPVPFGSVPFPSIK